jgi:predicted transcriptional regulator
MYVCTGDKTLLEEQTRQLLTALSEEKWTSRAELAKLLGKKRLNPYEVAALDMLTAQGQIEAEKRPAIGPIGYQWFYRRKEGA